MVLCNFTVSGITIFSWWLDIQVSNYLCRGDEYIDMNPCNIDQEKKIANFSVYMCKLCVLLCYLRPLQLSIVNMLTLFGYHFLAEVVSLHFKLFDWDEYVD